MPIESNIKEEILNDNTNITSNSKQLAVLKQHFPNCFDKEGNFMSHKMEEIVGQSGLELSKESYSLNWLGKSYSRLLANEYPRTLLKENKIHNALDQNKNSENLLIKGDNLEVLKHLSHAYSEQIKMIYIDPPYNTGGDGFVYNDDRKFTVEELSRLAGVEKDEAKRILDFTASKANSHSAWLTFMYPRLYVARELLREDGVIFISIDDNEVSQLKLLCDEVFGEENFYTEFIWQKRSGSMDSVDGVSTDHEYILSYGKRKIKLNGVKRTFEKYKNPNNDLRGDWIIDNLSAGKGGGDVYYEIIDPKNGNTFLPPKGRFWSYNPKTMKEKIDEDRIVFPKDKMGRPMLKRFKNEAKFDFLPVSSLLRNYTNKNLPNNTIVSAFNTKGTSEIQELFDSRVFLFPKSTILLSSLMSQVLNPETNDLILDFFAGSGTTAHAVMALNAEDKGNRKFITVQIDEKTEPKSEAYKAGYESIFDITKARIEKASVALGDQSGFKIFETTPLFEGYLDEIEELNEETTLFNGQELNSEELEQLLITWKSHDGMFLTEDLQEVMFGEYVAQYGGNTLYLMQVGFSMDALEVLIEKLDNDADFEPSKIVLFGYNFESKVQRELKEGLKNYKNKKSIELEMIVRY